MHEVQVRAQPKPVSLTARICKFNRLLSCFFLFLTAVSSGVAELLVKNSDRSSILIVGIRSISGVLYSE